MAAKRLYTVTMVATVPVWASSEDEAIEMALDDLDTNEFMVTAEEAAPDSWTDDTYPLGGDDETVKDLKRLSVS